MKRIGEMSRAALAAFVQEHLRAKGGDLVPSGGSCVSIYTGDKYVSMDLDMEEGQPAFLNHEKVSLRSSTV